MAVTPGWYPDPDDPANLRWWDGSAWTAHRRQAPSSADPAPAPEPGMDGSAVPTTTSTNAPIVVIAALVAFALVAAGAYIAFGRDGGPAYTWQGMTIAAPQLTIDAADEIFLDGASERNGSVGEESRCHYVLDTSDGADAGTDVADYLRCGPIRFVDGDPDDVWLTYALNAREDDGGDVHLSTAEQPQTSEPSPLGDDETLSRPDGTAPPEGDGDLDEPAPPRVEPGFLLADADRIHDVEPEETEVSAVGRTTSVTLLGVGEPDRFGVGQEARRPADGEKFVVFDIDITSGDELLGTDDEAGEERAVEVPVVIERADLLYHVTENPDVVPSEPDKAFLVIRNVVRSPEVTALAAGHLTLEIGGDVVEGMNIAPSGGTVVAFEVPADFETGTLVVGGVARSGGLTVDLGNPDFRVPIEIPGP